MPGLISFFIVENLTTHKETPPFRLLLHSFLMGFLCYLLFYPITLISWFNFKVSFIQVLLNESTPLNLWEILFCTIISVPLGFLISFLINKKILNKIAKKLGVTNKFGDLDVWSYIMDSRIPKWVRVRDIEHDLMYEGHVYAYSASFEPDELFLMRVKVFTDSTAELLYEIPGLYLAQKRDKLIIEFPEIEINQSKENQSDKNMEVSNE